MLHKEQHMNEGALLFLGICRYANRNGKCLNVATMRYLSDQILDVTPDEMKQIWELIKADAREVFAMRPEYEQLKSLLGVQDD
jgi:hypothetical protein